LSNAEQTVVDQQDFPLIIQQKSSTGADWQDGKPRHKGLLSPGWEVVGKLREKETRGNGMVTKRKASKMKQENKDRGGGIYKQFPSD